MNDRHGELAAAMTPLVKRFQQLYLGRSPADTSVNLVGDLLIVRSRGVLTEAETRLLQADPGPAGRDLIETLYRRMVKQAQAGLVGAAESILGVEVRAVHCDLDAAGNEGLLVLALDRDPASPVAK